MTEIILQNENSTYDDNLYEIKYQIILWNYSWWVLREDLFCV